MRFCKTNEERARRGSDIMTLSATKDADVAESLCWTGVRVLLSCKTLLNRPHIIPCEIQCNKPTAAAARKMEREHGEAEFSLVVDKYQLLEATENSLNTKLPMQVSTAIYYSSERSQGAQGPVVQCWV